MSKPKQQEDVSFYWRIGKETKSKCTPSLCGSGANKDTRRKGQKTLVPGQETKASHPNGSLGSCALRLTASKHVPHEDNLQ